MEKLFLKGKKIGLSISENPEIEKYGLSKMHIEDALVEFARYLLITGGNIVYGGSISYSGEFNYSDILITLLKSYVKEYQSSAGSDNKKITIYNCYPFYNFVDIETKAKLKSNVTFIKTANADIKKDIDENNFEKAIKGDTFDNQIIMAKNLTKMRSEMSEFCDARIMIGGKTKSFKGRYPGIIEEAYFALMNDNPIYVVGAFGGCGEAIIKALKGEKSEVFTVNYQFENKIYNSFVEKYNEKNSNKIDYDELYEFFKNKGVNGINNGLSNDENEQLFYSTNISEMISLILKGLKCSFNLK